MKHPYSPPTVDCRADRNDNDSSTAFRICLAVIVAIGLASIVGRYRGIADFGVLGGYGHFPLVWIGGFAVYPGYIHGLLLFEGGDWSLCLIVAIFMLGFYSFAVCVGFKYRKRNPLTVFAIFYVVSLILNFFNFIFIGLLYIS